MTKLLKALMDLFKEKEADPQPIGRLPIGKAKSPLKPSPVNLGPSADEYPALFQQAIDRTRRFGLLDCEFEPQQGRLLFPVTQKAIDKALKKIVREMFGGQISQMAGQCFTVNTNIAVDLRQKLRKPPVLTFGSVYGYKGRMFGLDVGKLERHLQVRDRPGPNVDMHAWLTFPTYEIVDLTLLTTVAQVGANIGIKAAPGLILAGNPVGLPAVRYEPQVVGFEVIDALGMFRGFAFTG